MPTRNVVITDRQAGMIERLVQSGEYQNASEVLREGLRLLEERRDENEIKLATIREAGRVGWADIEAGRHRSFTTEAELRAYVDELIRKPAADTGE